MNKNRLERKTDDFLKKSSDKYPNDHVIRYFPPSSVLHRRAAEEVTIASFKPLAVSSPVPIRETFVTPTPRKERKPSRIGPVSQTFIEALKAASSDTESSSRKPDSDGDLIKAPPKKLLSDLARVVRLMFRPVREQTADLSKLAESSWAEIARTVTLNLLCRIVASQYLEDSVLSDECTFDVLLELLPIHSIQSVVSSAIVGAICSANSFSKMPIYVMQIEKLLNLLSPHSLTPLTTGRRDDSCMNAILSILQSVVSLSSNQTLLRQTLLNCQIFVRLASVLTVWSEDCNPEELACRVIDCLLAIFSLGHASRQAFANTVTYPGFRRLFQGLTRNFISPRILQRLLNMTVGRAFDERQLDAQVFENGDAVVLLLQLTFDSYDESLFRKVLAFVTNACRNSPHNCNKCTSRSLVNEVSLKTKPPPPSSVKGYHAAPYPYPNHRPSDPLPLVYLPICLRAADIDARSRRKAHVA